MSTGWSWRKRWRLGLWPWWPYTIHVSRTWDVRPRWLGWLPGERRS